MRPDPLAYAGARVALLTRHAKSRDIGPVLGRAVGCEVLETDAFDTDRLGTFDGSVRRTEDQLATARRKARLGMELTGLPLGLGSEGAFGPDPLLGFSPWDVELVLWLDPSRGIEVAGWAQGPAKSACGEVADLGALERLAEQGGFPSHHLVLRPVGGDPSEVHKGLSSLDALLAAFGRCLAASPDGRVRVETDLRAHGNPTRRDVIRRAAEDLAARLATPCPACGSPGFGIARREPGLPCADCGEPTLVARAEVHACPACGHEAERAIAGRERAGPESCPRCNP